MRRERMVTVAVRECAPGLGRASVTLIMSVTSHIMLVMHKFRLLSDLSLPSTSINHDFSVVTYAPTGLEAP